METSARLAIEAIVLGLRRSGAISDHAMMVINDELRSASRFAREALDDRGGDQIDRIASTLHDGGHVTTEEGAAKDAKRPEIRFEPEAPVIPERAARSAWFLGIPIGLRTAGR